MREESLHSNSPLIPIHQFGLSSLAFSNRDRADKTIRDKKKKRLTRIEKNIPVIALIGMMLHFQFFSYYLIQKIASGQRGYYIIIFFLLGGASEGY